MSDEIKTGSEPAMPVSVSMSDNELYSSENIENGSGFTKRERAAIDLRVADSGTSWLNAMIEKSNRQELAKAAMIGNLSSCGEYAVINYKQVAAEAFRAADAMLRAGEDA